MNFVFRLLCCCVAGFFTMQAVAQPVDRVVAANYPPLMSASDTARPGYAIEVMQEAARRAGREIDLSFQPFARAMETLRTESAVLMPALFYGKKRNDAFLWVAEIQRARLRFATLSTNVDTLRQARELPRIVVERGSTPDAFLTNLGFENLVRTGGPDASAGMLQHGRADAWMQDDTILVQTWKRAGYVQPMQLGKVVHEIPIFLVASRDLPADTRDAYRNAIDNMRESGTLDAIWQKYTMHLRG